MFSILTTLGSSCNCFRILFASVVLIPEFLELLTLNASLISLTLGAIPNVTLLISSIGDSVNTFDPPNLISVVSEFLLLIFIICVLLNASLSNMTPFPLSLSGHITEVNPCVPLNDILSMFSNFDKSIMPASESL